MDLGASFNITARHEIMKNYIAGNYDNVYFVDGELMDIVGIGDVFEDVKRVCIENS